MRLGSWWMAMLGCAAFLLPGVRSGAQEAAATMNTAVADYNRGLELLKTNQLSEALYAFEKALAAVGAASDQDGLRVQASAANNAGNILLTQGKPVEAEARFRQAVKANPRHALAMNNLGAALLRQGKIAEAQAAFERAVRTDPRQVMALNNLAELLLQAGQFKLALQYLQSSLRIQPNNPEALLKLARVYERLDMPARQEEVWQALVKVTGEEPEARLRLATHYLKQGSLSDAEKTLQALLAERPEWPEALLQLARVRSAQERGGEAEAALRALLATAPDTAAIRGDLAAVLLAQGRMEEALALAEGGVQRAGADAEAWFVLGRCRERAGKLVDAEQAYLRAVKADSQHARALNNLGVLAAKRHEAAVALNWFEQALAADPYYAEAQYNLGRALVTTKTDHARGIRLVGAAAKGSGEAAQKARDYLNELEKIVAARAAASANAAEGSTP